MRFPNSLKRRVAWILGIFTLMLSILYLAVSFVIAYIVEDWLLENILEREANFIVSSYQSTNTLLASRVDFIRLYTDKQTLPVEVTESLRLRPKDREVFSDSGQHFHIRRIELENGQSAILVANVTELLAVRNLSGEILLFLAFVGFLALSLSLLLAYLIARLTVKPIIALTEQVISYENTQEPLRLSKGRGGDEITFLASTVEKSMNELKAAIKREHEFTRDISHELRTPMTILSNTLALSKSRPMSAMEIDQLNQLSRSMDNIISTLLALARKEALEVVALPLRPLLEEIIVGLYPTLSLFQFQVKLNVTDNFKINANDKLVKLLVTNLIENAIAHANGRVLEIHAAGDLIIFENSVSNSIDQDIMEQGTKGNQSQGLGHGLYLVKRLLAALNWRYQIDSAKEKFKFIIIISAE